VTETPLEVVILKPTPVFLSFLAAQVTDIDLPDLKLLQTDTTAYVIKKQSNDEATLDELERLYRPMFHHEIARWIGADVCSDIEASFLDFLCCFKFEMHSQIVLMEQSINLGKQLLCIKPRSVLLKWLKSALDGEDNLVAVVERIKLSHLVDNSTVMIKNFKTSTDLKSFVQQYFRPMFKTEMLRMSQDEEIWPAVQTPSDFSRYFNVELHTQLVHLH
jgi:hypothetical protein